VDEDDLLEEIEFIFCGPLIPNPIGKLFDPASIALSSFGKWLKTDKLQLDWLTPAFHLGLKTQVILVDEEDLAGRVQCCSVVLSIYVLTTMWSALA
jgi:hypothetical protein